MATSQTFLVDAAGGPGSNFTSIAAAVATVPDGAVLVVRAGTYAGFTIANKGLTVLGEAGVVILEPVNGSSGQSGITIQNTGPTQRVTLRELVVGGAARIQGTSCAGLVLLDRIVPAPPTILPAPLQLYVSQCDQVLATNCSFQSAGFHPGIQVSASRLVMVDCTAGGVIASAIEPLSGDVTLVSCSVFGGGSSTARAIFSQSAASLRLLGTTSIWSPGPCIEGGFAVRIAPTVTLSNAPVVSSLTSVADERVTGTGGAVGGSVSATMHGAAGNLAVMFLGLPGPAIAPGIPDTWWLDPAISASVAMGILTGPVTATVAIPPNATLQGLGFGFQALHLSPTGLSVSNPYQFVIQ